MLIPGNASAKGLTKGKPSSLRPAALLGYTHAMHAQRLLTIDRQAAEELATAALGFVAADQQLLPRFLALSGIEAGQIRRAAAEPGFLAGVLGFILAHEPTLDAFCASSGVEPARVSAALRALPFGDDRFEAST